MPYYETVFIARQDISSTQVETIADTMAEIITGDSGKISRREYWGLKSLAYRMKKNKKGHFVLFNFDAPNEAVREMERQMGLHEDVLRFLTLRTDDLPEEPSVVTASRSERGGRYGKDRDRPREQNRSRPDESKPASKPESKPETAEPAQAAGETA
jgi:small subunit ribosomal protein S6